MRWINSVRLLLLKAIKFIDFSVDIVWVCLLVINIQVRLERGFKERFKERNHISALIAESKCK